MGDVFLLYSAALKAVKGLFDCDHVMDHSVNTATMYRCEGGREGQGQVRTGEGHHLLASRGVTWT